MALLTNLLKLTSRNPVFVTFTSALNKYSKNFSSGAYEPDGKTVLNILNNDESSPLMIDGYSAYGFRLNNGIFVIGPVALFPHSLLSWNVENDADINERSLSLFLHIWPKLDVFIVGVSDATNHKLLVDTRKNVYNIFKSKGYPSFNFEVLPTEKAVATFNFLNLENRYVGAALIPPTTYAPTLDDEYRTDFLNRKREGMDVFLDK